MERGLTGNYQGNRPGVLIVIIGQIFGQGRSVPPENSTYPWRIANSANFGRRQSLGLFLGRALTGNSPWTGPDRPRFKHILI